MSFLGRNGFAGTTAPQQKTLMSIHLSPTERHSQKGPYGRPYANAGWRCSATIADDDELPPRSSQDNGFGYATMIKTYDCRVTKHKEMFLKLINGVPQ
jgi:hypothetical protein